MTCVVSNYYKFTISSILPFVDFVMEELQTVLAIGWSQLAEEAATVQHVMEGGVGEAVTWEEDEGASLEGAYHMLQEWVE